MAEVGDLRFRETLSVLISSSSYRNARGALAAAIGLSPSAISQYLAGTSLPRVDVLAKLAKALHVSTDYLIFGSERNLRLSREQAFFQLRVEELLAAHDAGRNRREWLRLELARRIEERIERTIAADLPGAIKDATLGPGFLRDEEVREIERVSQEVVVVSTTLRYNVVADEDGAYKPGPFADTVVEGIVEGRRYIYVVPSTSALRGAADAMIRIFCDMANRNVAEQVRVVATDVPFVGGFLLYRLDMEELSRRNPYLAEKVKDSLVESTLGLMANTSKSIAGDMILDSEHLSRAEQMFKHIITKAA